MQEGSGHHGVKDSRALWMGDMDYILTSGFDSVRPVIFHVDVKRKPRLFKFIFFTTNMLNLIVFFLYIDRESFSAKTSSEDVYVAV